MSASQGPWGHRDHVSMGSVLSMVLEDYSCNKREWTRPGFQALVVYRLTHWADTTGASSLLCTLLRSLNAIVRKRFDIDISPQARLGRRLEVGHQGGIVIDGSVVMGDDCFLLQGVRIGCFTRAAEHGKGPRIGNGVKLGARAIVDGPLHVGKHCRIGPNAIVTRDVPEGAVAIAPPASVTAVREPAAIPCAARQG